METTALCIGYAILVIIGLALIALAAFIVYLTIAGFFRIIRDQKSIRFMRRAEAKAINKGGKCAYDFLIKHGCPESITLKEVAERIEKHRIHYKLENI